jgi:hypothetical protein
MTGPVQAWHILWLRMAGSGVKSAQKETNYIVQINCHASKKGLDDKCYLSRANII